MPQLPQPDRKIGLWTATAVVIGESISLGIFLTPASMARSVGSPALLAAVWCALALHTLAGALTFSELALRNPVDGGEYVYLRRFGPSIAFLYAWMAAVVMYPGVAAALCVGLVPYIQTLVPLPGRLASFLPALLLVGAGVVNYIGATFSRRITAALNWLKIPVLVGLVAWSFTAGHGSISTMLPLTVRRPGSDPLAAAIGGAAVAAFYCFGGWWEASKIAGEVRNPSRILPIAFSGGVLVVSALYLLVSFAFLAVVPLAQVHSNTAFVAQFGQALFGASGARVLSACVVLCVLGGVLVVTMAVPRVTCALAQAEFPSGPLRAFGRLHPRNGTPANAVLLQTAVALLVLTLGAFDSILAFIIFPAVVFLGLTAATIFRSATPVRRWWYPAAPIAFIVGCAMLALTLLLNSPIPTLIGAVIVLAGLPVRILLRRSSASGAALASAD